MALTSTDETDLLLPLYHGVHENPLFSTFLARLRRRTGADYIALVIRQGDTPMAQASEFFAGADLRRQARELGIGELHTLDLIHHDRLRPDRVYSTAEFVDHDPAYKAQREDNIERLGITDERVIRITGTNDVDAWMVLARAKACTAADSALLSTLAPYVAVALRNLVLIERQRIDGYLSTQGLTSCGMGWMIFDSEARILSVNQTMADKLREITGISPTPGERLRNIPLEAQRTLAAAATDFSSNPLSAPRPLLLCNDPRVEALLTATDAMPASALKMPAMLAMYRLPRRLSPDRPDRLAQLFDLPHREAELAIALSDGKSIAEAAQEMGLTLETARNYSKRLYAKLGVRGQSELVRLVYESSAVLA